MNWLSFVAIGIFLAVVVIGCWLIDRQGTSARYTPGQTPTDDGVVALGVTLTAAMAANDVGLSDAASDTSSSGT